jgi:putative lipoic acid-binding regulatory protein
VSEVDPPRITFPCPDYPIKVVARASEDLRERLDGVFTRHFGAFEQQRVIARNSAQQNFVSFTYVMHVNDASQLGALHTELMSETGVVMVL